MAILIIMMLLSLSVPYPMPMRSGDLLGLAVDLDVGEMRLCSYRQAAASAC